MMMMVIIIIIIIVVIVVISGLGPRVLGLLNLQNLAIPKAKLQLSSHGPLLVVAHNASELCSCNVCHLQLGLVLLCLRWFCA